MAGSMSRQDLAADFRSSLQDSAEVFETDAEGTQFLRLLDLAASDLARIVPRRRWGGVMLVADQATYAAPADLLDVGAPYWGLTPRTRLQPWEAGYPAQMPQLIFLAGDRLLQLSPAPSASDIAALGADYRFTYYARHVLSDIAANTTVLEGDRGKLLLRAQAEAMKELAIRNIKKPVQMRDGVTSAPRNGTPAALWQALMDEFDRLGGG
jgi:hypothetical protein